MTRTPSRPRAEPTGPPLYVPGRTVPGAVTMSGNESAVGPMSTALIALQNAIRDVHRYPDTTSSVLVDAIAQHLSTPPETVTVGAGSAALLQRLLTAVGTGVTDEVLAPYPAFQAYAVFAANARLSFRGVPLTPNWAVDLDAIRTAIGTSTRVVVISNPHNPTGTLHDQDTVRRFLATVPDDVLVVLDEAYIEYAEHGSVDGMALATAQWASGRDNVAVLRTFSKAYGLAGLRVGYLIAAPALTAALSATALPFEVSSVGQAAALAALTAQDTLRVRCDLLARERRRVQDALQQMGFAPPLSQANHVWLPVAEDAERFEEHCLDFGITVFAYPDLGIRVTLGSRADNDLLLAAARAWAAAGQAVEDHQSGPADEMAAPGQPAHTDR